MRISRRILLGITLILLLSLCVLGMVSCDDESGSTHDPVSDSAPTSDNASAACMHAWGAWSVTVESKCETAGTRTRTCATCSETEAETVAALSHSFVTYTPDNNATCQANMTETATCARCDKTHTREVADSKNASLHTSEETEYQKNKTDVSKHDKLHACCGALILTEDHAWDDGTVDGTVTVYTCTLCQTTHRVPQAGHTHEATYTAAKAADCTTTGNIAYWYCEGCNTYFSDEALTQQLTQNETQIAPGHTSTEFIYEPDPLNDDKHVKKHKCCGAVVEALAHDFQFKRTLLADCDTQGGKEYECICNAKKLEDVTAATGHSVEIWNFVSETPKSGAACTYDQVYGGDCFVCGETQTKNVETVRHSFVATVTAYPTCQSAGSKSYACACGATPTVATVSIPATPTAHHWDAGTVQGSVTTYSCETQGCLATKTALIYAGSTQSVNTSDLSDNELVLGGVSLRLDSDTLALLDDSQEVSVSASPVTDRDSLIASLPEGLRGQITTTTPIYDFTLSQNGTPISRFGEGVITITIPYQLPSGVDADCVAIWYVAENGDLRFYRATYYEVETEGFLTFEASHFSTYLPGVAPSENACELYGHNDQETTVAPTCTERGYTEYHCQRCGDSRIDDVVYALGHAYDAGTGTTPTCTVAGVTTYTCTRTGCSHTNVVTVYAPHTYVYDSESSVAATCLTDGCTVSRCSASGCTAEKRETVTAYGSHSLYVDSVALAMGATKCTDGVVVTKKCYNCNHTEAETVRGEHVSPDKYGYSEDDDPSASQSTIPLGTYLTAAGISYMDEPVITLTNGCLCGEHKREIWMSGGTSQYGGELFMVSDSFSEHSRPNNAAACRELLVSSQAEMLWDPVLQMPVEGPVFNIQFKEILDVNGCHNVYSVQIRIGYDETTGNAQQTYTYVLAEYDSHAILTTATIADPTKTCYESCFDENREFYYGIAVTETCKLCNEVIRTYTDAVNTSSSHFWFLDELYEYRDENCSATYYGVRVHIKTCPCGKTEYSLYTGDCQFTSTTVNGATVYTCTDCGYIYATKTETVEDRENCRYTVTKYLWLDCESTTDFTSCEKTVVCLQRDEAYHYSVTQQTNENNPEATTDPCRYYVYKKNVCDVCGHESTLYAGYRMIHDTIETTVTDSHGNVTVTETCRAEDCGYLHITVKDRNGNSIRQYTAEKDYGRQERSVVLYTWKLIGGEIRPTIDRSEYYDLQTGEIVRWYQTVYTYEFGQEKGCTVIQIFTNHQGSYSRNESLICTFDGTEYQYKTCLQDGYEKQTCTVCGREEYLYFEEAYGHYYGSSWWIDTTADNYQLAYYRCDICGACSKDSAMYANVDVMAEGEQDGTFTVQYRNRTNTSASTMDATCSFVVYTMDAQGYLVVNEEYIPITQTLTGITVIDDGAGRLSFSTESVQLALAGIERVDSYSYTVCLIVTDTAGNVTYLPIC